MPMREMQLRVTLTATELAQRADEQAAAMKEWEDAESEKKEATKEIGARIERHRNRARELSRIVRDKFEERPVLVADQYHFDEGLVVTVRQDTGEIVFKREMTPVERQENLPGIASRGGLVHLDGGLRPVGGGKLGSTKKPPSEVEDETELDD